MGDHLVGVLFLERQIPIKSLTLEGTHSNYVSSGLENLQAVTTWSFWDFSTVSYAMPSIASDSGLHKDSYWESEYQQGSSTLLLLEYQ